METRRTFIQKAGISGISGILATGQAPVFAQDIKEFKIGQIGLGSHGFAARFKNPSPKYKDIIRCKPYAVWDDVSGVAEKMLPMGFHNWPFRVSTPWHCFSN